MVILGREMRWTEEGLEYEADKKHRTKVLDHSGFGKGTAGAMTNGGRVIQLNRLKQNNSNFNKLNKIAYNKHIQYIFTFNLPTRITNVKTIK